MAEPIVKEGEGEAEEEEEKSQYEDQENQLKMEGTEKMSRKEKRKAMKKTKRRQVRKEIALKEREEEETRLNDPEEQARLRLLEQEEAERMDRERKEFEERERAWLEAMETKKKMEAEEREEEEERRKALEDSQKDQVEEENECGEGDDWEYIDGPPEIIWQGNEIIVKKKRVRVPKKDSSKEDDNRPTSNPLPPQSEAFADYNNASKVSAQQMLENVAQQVPNFGTELDKAHCPFHLKTGACRFGQRCSRAHFYPDKSCTLLIKNMYSGPGIALEQDEGLEHTDEEVECCFEEFYEDVHTEFLKFGEIVNFKVCRNGSFHLRGNVYIHYKSLDSAVMAYQSINGRYFAGKQVSCEFVNVTKWKIAICGEYMKSRFKTCSRGTACNFIHCFRNPGGDYEWADWDKLPPRYWMKKMVALFGCSDEFGYEKQMEHEHLGQSRSSSKIMTEDADRHYSRRSRYREMDRSKNGRSGGSWDDENDAQRSKDVQRHIADDRERMKVDNEKIFDKQVNHHSMSRSRDTDSDGDWSDREGDRNRGKDRHHAHGRKSSRHRNKLSRSPNDYVYSKKRTHESGSSEDYSDRDGDRHHGHGRKSSRHRNKVSRSPNDYEYSKKRTHESDSSEDFSDRDGDRHHVHRKSSRYRDKVSRSPDDYEYSKKRIHESDSSRDSSDRDVGRETRHGRTRKGSRKRSKAGLPNDNGNKRRTKRTDWDQLDKDRDGETHHSHKGESSRHHSKDQFLGHHGDRKKRTRGTDSGEE